SENTVITTASLVKRSKEVATQFPTIGRPIFNHQIYIVDADFNPVPVGVAGELIICGIGLGRSYFNRTQLNAEKFITLKCANNQRAYRTGDLVRYLPNGEIDFIGRIDGQIKLRGYRIELGE